MKTAGNVKVRSEGFYWVRLRNNDQAQWGMPVIAEFSGGLWHTCGCEVDADSADVAIVDGPLTPPMVDGLYWVQFITRGSPKSASAPEVARYQRGQWYAIGCDEPEEPKDVHVLQGPIEMTGRLSQPPKPHR